MFVYLGVFAGLAIFAIGTPDRRSVAFFALTSIFLITFMGFRYETGCDYHGYLNRWINYNVPASVGDIFRGEEVGFALLTASIKASGLGYTWLNVAASVILVACYVAFARAHRFAPLILALLFPVVIVQLGMSGIRQALAGGFLMLALNAFMRRQKLWTATLILLGMQFHASVVIFLPLALLAGREVGTIRLVLALAVLGPVASLLLADRFDTYSDRYIEQIHGAVTSGGAVIRYALVALPVLLFVRLRHKVKAHFPEVYPLLKISALMITSLAPLVLLSTIALHRLNYYLMPASILIAVYVGAVAFRGRTTGQWLAVLAYGSYSFLWFLSSSHAQACYVPYENTLFL